MASKNKVIVHIGDELLYSVFMDEVEASGGNKSEFLRKLLEEKLSGKVLEKKLLLNRMYPCMRTSDAVSAFPLDMTINRDVQITKDGVYRLHKIDETICDEYESLFFGMMGFSLKHLKNMVREEAAARIPDIIRKKWPEIEYNNGDGSGDVNLIFINRVNISFGEYRDNKFYVRIKIYFHVSRFLYDSVAWNDDFLRIDFLNIKYLRFKYIATNGCLTKNYHHWLYLKSSKETNLGGFFAGLLYTPIKIGEMMEKVQELLSKQDINKNGMLGIPNRFVKLHINSDQIKVDGRSFTQAYNIVDRNRKKHNEEPSALND